MLGCRWAALNATNGEMASVSMHSRGIRPLPDYVTGKPVAPRQMTLPKRACSNSATIADRKTGIGKHATRRTAKSLPLACLDRQRWSKSASVQAVSPVLLSRAGSTSTIQQIRPCSSGESRSGADLAGVEDALRNRVEQRTPAFEGGRLAARHNQKISCPRAFHAARQGWAEAPRGADAAATDAPLSDRNLRRLARRAFIGVGTPARRRAATPSRICQMTRSPRSSRPSPR